MNKKTNKLKSSEEYKSLIIKAIQEINNKDLHILIKIYTVIKNLTE